MRKSVSMQKLGGNIRAIREKQQMSVEELARRAGATPEYVCKAEAGKRVITLYALMCFCDALSVSASDLLDNVCEPESDHPDI